MVSKFLCEHKFLERLLNGSWKILENFKKYLLKYIDF